MDNANRDAVANALPESMFRYPSMLPESLLTLSIKAVRACVSRNGTVMTEPMRNTTMINNVNNSFLRSSGTFQASRIVLSN